MAKHRTSIPKELAAHVRWLSDDTCCICREREKGIQIHLVPKLIKHYKNNEISEAILLTDSCTETSWYQDALDTSTAYCHPKSRLKFYDPNNKIQSAHRPQTFFYFGNNPLKFCEIFKEKGYTINKSQDFQKDDTLLGYYNAFFDPFASVETQSS